MIWITNDRVEVDYAVKCAVGPDPFIYRFPNRFLCVGVVPGNGCAFEGRNRRTNHFEAPSMCARNQLPVRVNDVLSTGCFSWIGKILAIHFCAGEAEIIDSFK